MHRRLAFCLALIIILGTLLRLYRVETLGTFRADQVIELSSTRNILFGDFTLIGIKTSISEVRNGAVIYYLLAPVLLVFNFDPIAGAVLQTFLQILTVLITFYIGKKFLGIRKGLVAAFIVAFSPLLVGYSRQTLLAYYPLFFDSVIFLIAALLAQKFRLRLVLILGFLLGFSLQVHYSVLSVVLASFVLLFVFFRKKIGQYYLLLLVGFSFGFLPMIVFEIRNEFFNTKMLLAHFASQRGSGNYTNFLRFWPESIGAFLFGGKTILGAICLMFISLWTFFNISKLTKIQKVCLLFIFGTILMTLGFSKSINPPFLYIYHYMIAAFVPLVILLLSVLKTKRGSIVTILLVGFSVLNIGSYRFGESNGFSMSPNWSLTKIKEAARIIRQNSGDKKYNVAMLIDAETQGLPVRYFLDGFANPPMRVDQYREPEFLYVVSEPGTNLQTFDVWEINSFRPFKMQKKWDLKDGYNVHLVKRVLQN